MDDAGVLQEQLIRPLVVVFVIRLLPLNNIK